MKRSLSQAGFLAALALLPLSARADAPAIQHDAVDCIVVGKYPKLNACFAPAAQVARARVYFRPEAAPSWYFVEMTSDAPCFAGVLPKPTKKLQGKKVEYYVEVVDKGFAEGRTAEYDPQVVGSAEECKKRLAPLSRTGPSAVGGGTPVGFAGVGGGVPTAAVVGVAGAGAAAGGVALAASGGSDATTPATSAPATNPPATTAPPATTVPPPPTTVSTTGNRPPNVVYAITPSRGAPPLSVEFNLCRSTDPDRDPLRYTFDFGDGQRERGPCRTTHTYGASASALAVRVDDEFQTTGCVSDGLPDHEVCDTARVTVVNPPEPEPSPSPSPRPSPSPCGPPGPKTQITAPAAFSTIGSSTSMDVDALDADGGVRRVDFICSVGTCDGGGGKAPLPAGCDGSTPFASDSRAPYSQTFTPPLDCTFYCLKALATDNCGNTDFDVVDVFADFGAGCGSKRPTDPAVSAAPVQPTSGSTTWTSTLAVPDASGQIVVDGKQAEFAPAGRFDGRSRTGRGTESRVEAVLVRAAGAGSWRFELTSGFEPSSLKVIAGSVEQVTATAVVFRIEGRAGERVVFAFRAQ